MARPRLLVLAGRALFDSFFDLPRRRRLSRLYDWRRLPDRTVTPRVRAALLEARALVTTWDSPSFGLELLDSRARSAESLRRDPLLSMAWHSHDCRGDSDRGAFGKAPPSPPTRP